MSDFAMPKRAHDDGQVRVDRCFDVVANRERIFIGCISGGKKKQSDIACSPHNAVRILASLAVVLGVRLAKSFEKAIKL
jgi:hypothetical protein